ncbi:MAG: lytic transglycosylase domain-containing protein [Elusimicrobia bacterium]|nr:lytic transglycosylase domain-containing protein [Elusimicrobiota bacterium]
MPATLKLLLLAVIAVPVPAQAQAIDELFGSAPETRIQAPAPVPRSVEQSDVNDAGLPAEDAFLVKPDAEHDAGAELFNPFNERLSKSAQPAQSQKIPYFEMAKKEAAAQDVDINLILAVIQKESSFDPKAYNPSGAVGLMQVLPSTARCLGLKNAKTLWEPEVNIKYGVKYLKTLWSEFGADDTLSLAQCHPGGAGFANTLAAYNAGPGNVRKYHGVPPFKETKRYVALVTEYFNKFKQLLAGF